jgi:hypothetical protein
MDDTVKGKTLKKIGESLARFADVRETAKEPRDRVIVQANGTVMKFIAGSTSGTLVATVHATTQEFRAIIPARPLLQALKATSAKEDYRIEDLNRGYEIGCSLLAGNGEAVDFLRLSKKLPVIMLPPALDAQSQGRIGLEGSVLAAMGSILPSTCDWNKRRISVVGRIWTKNDDVLFASTDNKKFSSTRVKGEYDIFGTISADVLENAREIGDATLEFWTDQRFTLSNDTFKVVGPYRMLESAGPLETAGKYAAIEYRTVADRTKLVKSVREQAKLDKYGRIALQYKEDGSIEAKPFESKHGWYAMSENLLPILTAAKAKQVGIGLRTGSAQPINVRIPDWTIELAPVELRQPK